jgi:hypothetical protein
VGPRPIGPGVSSKSEHVPGLGSDTALVPGCSALALLVPLVGTDHTHHALAAEDTALVTHRLNAGFHLHAAATSLVLDFAWIIIVRPDQLLVAVGDPPASQVVGRHLYDNSIVRQDANVVHSHLAADVSQHLVAVVQFDPEHRIRKGLRYGPFHLDGTFFGHSNPPHSVLGNSLVSQTITPPVGHDALTRPTKFN